MITGLKVTVAAEELKTLCCIQSDYHRNRSCKYQEQVASMEANEIEGMNHTNGNPVQTLKDRQSKHANESAELTFIAEHLLAGETYLLDQSDLVKLGITKSRY